MGVKGLWTILDPLGEPKPLSELAGRSVAIDLSGWVVEAETAQSLKHAVNNPYLRNLVYRTSALLLQHTLPVFVLDGAAPQLKLQEMARRQGRPAASGGRHQLRGRLQRCARLLDALGVPHLTSDGEAEALCARLDADGRVDGVVSDDVDAALYGARTLYRHLTAGGTGGQVTRYCLRRVRDEMGLDAGRLRALALLIGCDFLPAGLPGLGALVAQQLVRRLDGRPLLPQLARWLREPPLSEMRAVGELGRPPSHCVHCGHPGTETRHRRTGCSLCGGALGCIAAAAAPAADDPASPASPASPPAAAAACPCDWHRQRRDADEHAAELKARDCARRTPEFEARAAAAEAELARTPPLPDCDLSWRRPDLARFTAEAWQELGWAPDQCWKVAAPLLARWQLRHGGPAAEQPLRPLEQPLRPLEVLRTSRHHHIDCYLVRWRLEGGELEITTNEPRPLVEAAHRPLVDAFLDSKKKPKKPRQPRKAKAASDAGPQAKMGSPSKLITDFFPTRKKAGQQAVSTVGQAKSGPSAVAAKAAVAVESEPISGQTTQNPDPCITSEARVSGTARHEADLLCIPAAGSASETADSHASDDSDSASYEELDSEESVADLSAIIDAITRTHIADDAVIVISDDDSDDAPEVSDDAPEVSDDAPEVSESERRGRHRGLDAATSLPAGRPARGGPAPRPFSDGREKATHSLSDGREKAAASPSDGRGTRTQYNTAVERTRLPVSVPAAAGCEDREVSHGWDRDARDSSPSDEGSVSVDAAGAAAADSASDDEYVPLWKRIELR